MSEDVYTRDSCSINSLISNIKELLQDIISHYDMSEYINENTNIVNSGKESEYSHQNMKDNFIQQLIPSDLFTTNKFNKELQMLKTYIEDTKNAIKENDYQCCLYQSKQRTEEDQIEELEGKLEYLYREQQYIEDRESIKQARRKEDLQKVADQGRQYQKQSTKMISEASKVEFNIKKEHMEFERLLKLAKNNSTARAVARHSAYM